MTVVVSLVSKDNESIVISNTETTHIGRGFFQCNDKRVSKNHGEVTVEDKTIKVKSCSVNPIFYKINGKGVVEILRKDAEVVLGNQDMFSLLPNEFEFTIKIEDTDNSTAFRVRPINEINENLEAGDMAVSLSQILREGSSSTTAEEPDSNSIFKVPDDSNQAVSSTTTSSSGRKRSLDEPATENAEIKKIKPSSSNSDVVQPSSTSEEQNKPAAEIPKIKPDPDSTDQLSSNQNLPSTSTQQQSLNVEVKPDPDAVKTEPTATDNNSASCQSSNNQSSAQARVRPSCEFGIRCYRLADDHRLAFAHPMDNDYRRPDFPPSEPGAPRCPYWDACYRRNPEHFRTMSHPSADQYTTQRPPQLQNIYHPGNNYNDGNNDDDDDDLFSDEEEDFDDFSDVDQDYEIEGSISSYDDDENNLEE